MRHDSSTEASWHADYRDTAYVFIGGLSFDLSEGDVVTIFSQFGEPVYIDLARDKDSGKSRGFAFLKYRDQRSTDLAVDNMGGSKVLGRVLKVDHTRYKKKDGQETGLDLTVQPEAAAGGDDGGRASVEAERRPMLKEEQELTVLMRDHDDDDPMKQYLIQEKREEVEKALARQREARKHKKKEGRGHHHHHRDRSERHDGERSRRQSHRSTSRERGARQARTRHRTRSADAHRRR